MVFLLIVFGSIIYGSMIIDIFVDDDMECWDDNSPNWECTSPNNDHNLDECIMETHFSECNSPPCCRILANALVKSHAIDTFNISSVGISFYYHQTGGLCNLLYSTNEWNNYDTISLPAMDEELHYYNTGLNISINDTYENVQFGLYSQDGTCTWDDIRLYGVLKTGNPTVSPIIYPTNYPTFNPSNSPSLTPSITPTIEPTKTPSMFPTNIPSIFPTKTPSVFPTSFPSINPSEISTNSPTILPSDAPTNIPSTSPTYPITSYPSTNPSLSPTYSPIINTNIQSSAANDAIILFLLYVIAGMFVMFCSAILVFVYLKRKEKSKRNKERLQRIHASTVVTIVCNKERKSLSNKAPSTPSSRDIALPELKTERNVGEQYNSVLNSIATNAMNEGIIPPHLKTKSEPIKQELIKSRVMKGMSAGNIIIRNDFDNEYD